MESTFFNSDRYFLEPRIDETGFREYDARWIIEPLEGEDVGLNYRGVVQLGHRLGQFLQRAENGARQAIVIGHDFRRYAENVKNALALGLVSSGLDVHDVGLCLTPIVYFAQYRYDIPACAMVTASHNPNGWTGVKMGSGLSSTFGPKEMSAFKAFTLASGDAIEPTARRGSYRYLPEARQQYVDAMTAAWAEQLAGLPRLRVAVETGNGTAGIFLPTILERLGFEVVAGHVTPDWRFPYFNPNPESIPFLEAVQALVRDHRAEVGLCIDGDGDRVGFVDDRGEIVFSDRAGLLIARDLEGVYGLGRVVVDMKSTSLYASQLRSTVVWEKTGHSYIKAAVAREQAIAGFERSGHFFFNQPLGHGYDDACLSALVMLWILAKAKQQGQRFSDLLAELPASHQSPNRQPKVSDHEKYPVVEELTRQIQAEVARDGTFGGLPVRETLTINGIRVNFDDDSWLLIRASSNTPNLVILAETFDADGSRLRDLDAAIRRLTSAIGAIGPYEPLYREDAA